MAGNQLTDEQKRLLLLISKFSKPADTREEEETWIKRIFLMVLVNRGIRMKLFLEYDFAPMLVEYMGNMRYANISRGGIDDVIDLREQGLVDRLKLATSHHIFISAYKITSKGLTMIADFEKTHQDAVRKLLGCNGCETGILEMEAREEAPFLVCPECGKDERIPIFDIKKIPYVSTPVFPDIWLPQD